MKSILNLCFLVISFISFSIQELTEMDLYTFSCLILKYILNLIKFRIFLPVPNPDLIVSFN